MTDKYISYNGIVFGAENRIVKDAERLYSPFIITEFLPNEVSTAFQKDDLIVDGAVYSNFRYDSRVFSLKGYILPREGERAEDLRRLLYTRLNGKNTHRLIYFDGAKKYFIDCIADAPVCAAQRKNTVEFNINFTAPAFFWYAADEEEYTIYGRSKNITNPFTLPRVFGETTAGADFENQNEFDIYPVVRIISDANETTNSFLITNETTGEKIEMTGYSVPKGKIVEVDCYGLRASADGTDVLNYFNDFSGFKLIPGLNVIKCEQNGTNQRLRAAFVCSIPYVGI